MTSGVEMDVLGIARAIHRRPAQQWSRRTRRRRFQEQYHQAFYNGMKHRPDGTFGTVSNDVLALKDSS